MRGLVVFGDYVGLREWRTRKTENTKSEASEAHRTEDIKQRKKNALQDSGDDGEPTGGGGEVLSQPATREESQRRQEDRAEEERAGESLESGHFGGVHGKSVSDRHAGLQGFVNAYDSGMNLPPVNITDRPDAELEIIEPLCAIFRRRLKAEGLKYTPERAQILDAIIRWEDDHPVVHANGKSAGTGGGGGVFQADQLLESMRSKGHRVSKATIYRTIKLLTDSGVLQQVLFDAEHAHYQLAYGTRSNALIVRVDTGEITAIDLPELRALQDRLCAERGVKPEGHRFVLYARG